MSRAACRRSSAGQSQTATTGQGKWWEEALGLWLEHYQNERTHTGRHCLGGTPYQTLPDTIPMAREKVLGKVAQDPAKHLFPEPALTPGLAGVGQKKTSQTMPAHPKALGKATGRQP
jgi:hypothetical protein